MPINYLDPIDKAKPSAEPFKKLQETYKRPFSFRALGVSLGIGVLVAVVVIGILLMAKNINISSQPEVIVEQEPMEEIDETMPIDDGAIVAGETIIDLSKMDSDGDGLFDWQEGEYGTNAYVADTDFDSYNDLEEIVFGYDPTGFGRPDMRVKIEKIEVDAPIIFPISTLEVDIQASMAKGVAHYPGTAMPGTVGNIYITGHSSDYSWNDGNYKRVFRKLNDLEAGDKIIIESAFNNGVVKKYVYELYDKQVTEVDDSKLWESGRNGSILTLVTSWPLDTTRQRLMVRGELIEN